MLANRWKLGVSLVLLFAGCSTQHQLTKLDSKFDYYPSGTYTASETYYAKDAYLKENSSSANVHRATLKPYRTFGIKYSPKVEKIGFSQDGIASWYGPNFHGKKTSNGEVYDMHEMTAAHKTLPMNTIVLVRHKKTNKTVKVRINDRGPFVAGRIIDLSFAAGKILGLDRTGTAPVELTVEKYDKFITANYDVGEGFFKEKNLAKFGVQLGAFANKTSAQNLKEKALQEFLRPVSLKTTNLNDVVLYRVVVVDFKSEDAATDFIQKHNLTARLIKMDEL